MFVSQINRRLIVDPCSAALSLNIYYVTVMFVDIQLDETPVLIIVCLLKYFVIS